MKDLWQGRRVNFRGQRILRDSNGTLEGTETLEGVRSGEVGVGKVR